MKNYDGAIVELKKALEIAPHQPGLHFKLERTLLGATTVGTGIRRIPDRDHHRSAQLYGESGSLAMC